jgi:hypothetical protein
MYRFINIFPLLALPLALYNMVVLTDVGGSAQNIQGWLSRVVFSTGAISGDTWDMTTGELVLFFSLLLLFIEIVKSTRTDAVSLINHGLATLVFFIFLLEFVTLKGFTNSIFFLLMTMQLIDVVAGYTVTEVAAKRDFGSPGGIIGTN